MNSISTTQRKGWKLYGSDHTTLFRYIAEAFLTTKFWKPTEEFSYKDPSAMASY
jgi:hypothetical protein